MVRRLEGRTVYLTEAAVTVFVAERERKNNEHAWEVARRRWLALAASVHAPEARRAKVRATPISAGAVQSAKTLYMTAAEHTAKVARHEKRWTDVAKIRLDQATALYAEAGSPLPPPEEALGLYREGKSAILRSIAEQGRHAEFVAAGCCRACRADDGKVFRISTELRTPRLPHEECPRGLCSCDWWFAIAVSKKPARRRSAKPSAAPAIDGAVDATAAGEASTTGDQTAGELGDAGVADDLDAELADLAIADEPEDEPVDETAGELDGTGVAGEPAGELDDAGLAEDSAGAGEPPSELDAAAAAGEGGGNGELPSTPPPVSRRRRRSPSRPAARSGPRPPSRGSTAPPASGRALGRGAQRR